MKNKIIIGLMSVVLAICIVAGWMSWRNQQLSDMVGQMILVGFRGTSSKDSSVRDVADDIRDGKIGGVILFSVDVEQARKAGISADAMRGRTKSRNIIDVSQVLKLNRYLSDAATDANRPLLFVSIDQEGGRVVRLGPEHGFDVIMPMAKDMAKMRSGDIYDLYKSLGTALRDLGFNLNFAPDTDVDVNSNSPAIGAVGRAFSSNAATVAQYGKLAVGAMWDGGVLSSFKHFPGHGSAGADTHIGLVDITNTWNAAELTPYQAVPEHTIVMVAHVINGNIDTDYPASLSAGTVDGLLRDTLGFDGVVITDDLQMGAIYNTYGFSETLRMAILAGNDILLLGNNLFYTENIGRAAHTEIMRMVQNGDIPRARIKKSYNRIIKIKEKLK